MQKNFFEQYKNGKLPEETKKYLKILQDTIKKFGSSEQPIDALSDSERKIINLELSGYLAGQHDKLPNLKKVLSDQEIEDLKKAIAALKEAGASFKLENENGVRRLKISFGSLSVVLAIGSLAALPVFGMVGLVFGAVMALASAGGAIASDKKLKEAIEKNKIINDINEKIGLEPNHEVKTKLEENKDGDLDLDKGKTDKGKIIIETNLPEPEKLDKHVVKYIDDDGKTSKSKNNDFEFDEDKIFLETDPFQKIDKTTGKYVYIADNDHDGYETQASDSDENYNFDESKIINESQSKKNNLDTKKEKTVGNHTSDTEPLTKNNLANNEIKNFDKSSNKAHVNEKKEDIKASDKDDLANNEIKNDVIADKTKENINKSSNKNFVNEKKEDIKASDKDDLTNNEIKNNVVADEAKEDINKLSNKNFVNEKKEDIKASDKDDLTNNEIKNDVIADEAKEKYSKSPNKNLTDIVIVLSTSGALASRYFGYDSVALYKVVDAIEKDEFPKTEDLEESLSLLNKLIGKRDHDYLKKSIYIIRKQIENKNEMKTNMTSLLSLLSKYDDKNDNKFNASLDNMINDFYEGKELDSEFIGELIKRLKDKFNKSELDFESYEKIKQALVYVLEKDLDYKQNINTKILDIINKIQTGDLLTQNANVTILDPGYKGEGTGTVDSMVFKKLGFENSVFSKEMQDNNIKVKFVENQKGSTVLNKIDFGFFEPTENNFAEVYYQSFKECRERTRSIACPLVGDKSLGAKSDVIINASVKGFEKFVSENPNSELDIKYIIYEKDEDAGQKVEAMKNGFKNLADKYNKELGKAKDMLKDLKEMSSVEKSEIKTHKQNATVPNSKEKIKIPSEQIITKEVAIEGLERVIEGILRIDHHNFFDPNKDSDYKSFKLVRNYLEKNKISYFESYESVKKILETVISYLGKLVEGDGAPHLSLKVEENRLEILGLIKKTKSYVEHIYKSNFISKKELNEKGKMINDKMKLLSFLINGNFEDDEQFINDLEKLISNFYNDKLFDSVFLKKLVERLENKLDNLDVYSEEIKEARKFVIDILNKESVAKKNFEKKLWSMKVKAIGKKEDFSKPDNGEIVYFKTPDADICYQALKKCIGKPGPITLVIETNSQKTENTNLGEMYEAASNGLSRFMLENPNCDVNCVFLGVDTLYRQISMPCGVLMSSCEFEARKAKRMSENLVELFPEKKLQLNNLKIKGNTGITSQKIEKDQVLQVLEDKKKRDRIFERVCDSLTYYVEKNVLFSFGKIRYFVLGLIKELEKESDPERAKLLNDTAIYILNKAIADEKKIIARVKDIYENKIKIGDISKLDKNTVILNPGYTGSDGVDSLVFKKLDLYNDKEKKEIKEHLSNFNTKFVKNENGSAVLNKTDFNKISRKLLAGEDISGDLAKIYSSSFSCLREESKYYKVLYNMTCPLLGDGSFGATLNVVVSAAAKGLDDFICSCPDDKMNIEYVIYEGDKNATKKVNAMREGFKNLADKHEKELKKIENWLDNLRTLEKSEIPREIGVPVSQTVGEKEVLQMIEYERSKKVKAELMKSAVLCSLFAESITNDKVFDSQTVDHFIGYLKEELDESSDPNVIKFLKDVAAYILNKEISNKKKLADRFKDICNNKIKKGDLLSQDSNITILCPDDHGEGFIGERIFDELGLYGDKEIEKWRKNDNVDAKFVEKDFGGKKKSTVLNKVDFNKVTGCEDKNKSIDMISNFYYQSFRECNDKTNCIASPLIGTGSMKKPLDIVSSAAVKGFDNFIRENKNSYLDVNFIIYKWDPEADKQVNKLKEKFEAYAGMYNSDLIKARKSLDEISKMKSDIEYLKQQPLTNLSVNKTFEKGKSNIEPVQEQKNQGINLC